MLVPMLWARKSLCHNNLRDERSIGTCRHHLRPSHNLHTLETRTAPAAQARVNPPLVARLGRQHYPVATRASLVGDLEAATALAHGSKSPNTSSSLAEAF